MIEGVSAEVEVLTTPGTVVSGHCGAVQGAKSYREHRSFRKKCA
jgi:hypothetical protein